MKTSQPNPIKAKYSIFMPVKNGAKYITAAIDSILAQQVSDFVLIILENKSTDNTLAIVRDYSDYRIIVIEAPCELDIYESWRRVHDLIQSDFVLSEFSTVIGHDDILYPNFLENIESLISIYPDASLYQTHFDLIDGGGCLRRPCKPIPLRESAKDFFLARCWGMRDSFGTGYVFRSKDYIKVGGIPDLPMLLWSDDLLIINLTKLSYKVCGNQPTFAYRLHNKSASGVVTAKKFKALSKALELYVGQVERRYEEFITYKNDRIAFGYLLARQVELLSFPLHKILLGTEVSNTVAQIAEKSSKYLGINTVKALSEASILERIWHWLKKCYISLKLIF